MSFVSDAAKRSCPNPLDSFNFDIVDGIDQIEVEQERLHKQIIAQIDKDIRLHEKKLNALGAKVTAVSEQKVGEAETAISGMYNTIGNELSGNIETVASATCHLPCPNVSFVGGSYVCYTPDNEFLGPAFVNPDATWSYMPRDKPECYGTGNTTNNPMGTTPVPTVPLPTTGIDPRVLSCFPDAVSDPYLPSNVYRVGINYTKVDDATGCCLLSATSTGPWAVYSCPFPGTTIPPNITTTPMPNVTINPTPTTPVPTTPYPTPKTPEECCIQLVQLVSVMSRQQDNQNTLISVLTKAIGELKGQPDVTVNCGDGSTVASTTPKPISTTPPPTILPPNGETNNPAECDDALKRMIDAPWCDIDTLGEFVNRLVKSKLMDQPDGELLTQSFAYDKNGVKTPTNIDPQAEFWYVRNTR